MSRTSAVIAPGRVAMAPPTRARGREAGIGNRSLQRLFADGMVRAKRAVSEPGDADERAADALADRVLGGGGCEACAVPAPCAACSDAPVLRQADGAASAGGGEAASALGGGRPLDPGSRDFFEPRFGVGLGEVRVHDDAEGAGAARDLGARAFAVGGHIAFAAGEHRPESSEGRRLLAHELAHVVQPTSARVARQVDAGVMDAADLDATVGDAGGGPTDAGLPAGVGTPPASLGFTGPGGPCGTPAEEARRDAFLLRTDLHLDRTIPSTGFGMFDVDYLPFLGLMPVRVKIAFHFADALSGPDLGAMAADLWAGRSIGRFFWNAAEEADYKRDYLTRLFARWSGKHSMRSTKPCWGFTALPVVTVAEAASDADSHYVVTVHKSPGPGIDYTSATSDPDLAHPDRPASANLWQSDVLENPDFNSTPVANAERVRLQAALAAFGATPIHFAKNSADIGLADKIRLVLFATACRAKNPSDPAIPIFIAGFASGEGDAGRNLDLSLDRALAVEEVLTSAGVPQPLSSIGFGATGAANDLANRRADISLDATFESSYSANRYSVAEHEFGHMLGLPDEYQDNTTGMLGTQQTAYVTLLSAAGVSGPTTWGAQTSSQMSNGVDVLPRHYATFWEALGRMTAPDIAPGEWSMR